MIHSTSTARSGLLQGTDAREEGLLELHLFVELPRQCIGPGPLSVCSLHFGADPLLRRFQRLLELLDPLALRVLLSSQQNCSLLRGSAAPSSFSISSPWRPTPRRAGRCLSLRHPLKARNTPAFLPLNFCDHVSCNAAGKRARRA